jgi:tetratricopeptide (TPR) repeat protein
MSAENIFPPEDEQQPQPSATGCAGCDHPVIEPGYPTPLCADCRQKFIRYPIPIGIKIFGACVAVLLIFAVAGVPKSLRAGVHYERGVSAVESKRFVTAQRELELALGDIPSFAEGKMYLALAAFYNMDMMTFYTLMQELQGEKVEDESLYRQLTEVSAKTASYLPSDSFYVLLDKYHAADSIPPFELDAYVHRYPLEAYSNALYAKNLLEADQYTASDSLLSFILRDYPDHRGVLNLKVSAKRYLKQYDSAMYYSDRIISLNRESGYGIASKARTMLNQKRDTEALQWALNAVQADGKDAYAKATLVLAYHFNSKITERDQLIDQLKKDTAAADYLQYPLDVIAGKEKFRD